MDLFAVEIGMDPVEVRERNLIPPDAFPFTTKGKVTYDSGEYAKALDRVLDAADYAELQRGAGRPPGARRPRPARHRRLGVRRDHPMARPPKAPRSRCTRTARSPCSPAPRGQGHATAWAMLAGEQLESRSR